MNPIRIYASGASDFVYDYSHYLWYTITTSSLGCKGGGGCYHCKFQHYSSHGCYLIQSTLYHLLKPDSGFITITYDDIIANYPEYFL